MRFNLATMAKRAGKLRRSRALPVITPTQGFEQRLAAIYMRVVRRWQELCRGELLQACEQELAFRAAMDRLTRDSTADVEAAIGQAGDELTRLILELLPELQEWVVGVERWHRGRWIAGALTASGVDLTTMLGPEDVREALQDVLARNVALIRNVSDEARGRISDVIYRGLRERRSAREVARDLRAALEMSRTRSILIASDQLNKLSASLDAERQRQAGLTEWIWRHSGKRHPREDHLARNMKHYTDETAPNDLPGQLPYCGCRRQAYLNLDD